MGYLAKNLCLVSIVFWLSINVVARSNDDMGFKQVINLLEEEGKLNNSDADSITLAKALMTEILTNEDAFNSLTESNGHLVLDEETAIYLLSSLKDKLKTVAIDTINYGLAKYDKLQDKLDEHMPDIRNNIADVLLLVNNTLSKIDPKIVGSIIKAAGSILGAVSSIVGAAFGVPVIPGLAISVGTAVLGNSYTVSGALAVGKTLLDIAEAIVRVDPNATPQTPEEKGNALKKIAEGIKFVGQHYVDNYAVYKPEEVEFVKTVFKAVSTKIFSFFM